jgi:hypothetical protein
VSHFRETAVANGEAATTLMGKRVTAFD